MKSNMKNQNQNEYQKALVYCRVSSGQQVSEGSGLESQEHRCIAYAEAKGLEVIKIFRDEGISGGLFERPAMKEVLKFLDKNNTEKFVVIFDDIKRFARDIEVHLKLKKEFGSREAKLECLNFKFEETPEGIFVENIIAATSQLEREQNRRQVIQKQKARLELGYWAFHAPPGLKFKRKNGEGNILTPDNEFSDIYKEAIEKFRDYELNTIEAVRHFIIEKYKQRGIKKFISATNTKTVLTNPLYAGYLEFQKWGVSLRKAKHKGFITYETLVAVEKRLEARLKPQIRQDINPDFPLRNYLLCPHCNHAMTASWHKGKMGTKYPHYWCKNPICQNKNRTLTRDTVHNDFVELLQKLTPNPQILKLAEAVLLDVWQKRQNGEIGNQEAVLNQINDLNIKIDNLTQRISETSNKALVEHYETELEKLLKQKAAVETAGNVRMYKTQDFPKALRLVFSYVEHPLNHWYSPAIIEQRALLHTYFNKGVSYDKFNRFGTPKLPLILEVLTQSNNSKITMVEMPGVKPGSKTFSLPNCSQD